MIGAIYITDDYYFHNIDVDTIRLRSQNLNCKKTTNQDLVPSKLLKLSSGVMRNYICKLLNMSINAGKYPNAMKYEKLCPVFKKDNKLVVSNYRHVNILLSMTKTFEREIVYQRTNLFSTILSPVLYGFRRKHSCEIVLL